MKAALPCILALTAALVTASAIDQSPEVVITLDQHESFFSELLRIEVIDAEIGKIDATRKDLDHLRDAIPKKGEFETTAEFHARRTAKLAEFDAKEEHLISTRNKLVEEWNLALEAVRRKQEELKEIVISLKVTMEPYDADTQRIPSFNTDTLVIGSYRNRTAAIASSCELRSIPILCSVELAKRLRESSDKGDLRCAIWLASPQLELACEGLELPTTSGERLQTGLMFFLGALLSGGSGPAPSGPYYKIPDTKVEAANILKIKGFKAAQHLVFFDQNGVIIDLRPKSDSTPSMPQEELKVRQ